MKGFPSSCFYHSIFGGSPCANISNAHNKLSCSCVRFDAVFPQIGANFNSTKEIQTAFADHNILDELCGCTEVSF